MLDFVEEFKRTILVGDGKTLQSHLLLKDLYIFEEADWMRTSSAPPCGHLFQLALRVTQERSWQHNMTLFLICLQTCRVASYLLSASSCSIQNPAQHSPHTWSPTHPLTQLPTHKHTAGCGDQMLLRQGNWEEELMDKKERTRRGKGHNKKKT